MKNSKLLVVVDESPAARKALQYVAQMASGRSNFRVCLAHRLLSPPRQLVELRGTEKGTHPSIQVSMDCGDRDDRTAGLGARQRNSVPRRPGTGAIEAHYCYLVNGSGATKEILKLAQMRKCDTVVIGRKSLSWLSELIHGDPAEEFVRQGKGFTIWVVE